MAYDMAKETSNPEKDIKISQVFLMLLFLVLILVNISMPNECLQHGLVKLTLFTQNNVIYIRVLWYRGE
jgi:hypothetical protein